VPNPFAAILLIIGPSTKRSADTEWINDSIQKTDDSVVDALAIGRRPRVMPRPEASESGRVKDGRVMPLARRVVGSVRVSALARSTKWRRTDTAKGLQRLEEKSAGFACNGRTLVGHEPQNKRMQQAVGRLASVERPPAADAPR
jgi:hypothetical protein